jgi:hypothetical protein
MFLGHYALALGAKRLAPRASLGVLFVAAQWADLLWPILLLVGRERVAIEPGNTAFTPLAFTDYPISHSLLALAVWGLAGAVVCGVARGHAHSAAAVAVLVVSHWVLDVVTHRADMPIVPGGREVGLGLWNSVPATIAVEAVLYAAGVAIYLRSTRARDATGRWATGALLVALALIYVANVAGGAPPSVTALAWVALAAWLFPLWAWWADGHRTPTSEDPA